MDLMTRRRALMAKIIALVKMVVTSATGLVSFVTDIVRPVKVTCEFSPVQEGTGDPSPDNVRPISGWTEANVKHTGKNLWNPDISSDGQHIDKLEYFGTLGSYGVWIIQLSPNTKYRVVAYDRISISDTIVFISSNSNHDYGVSVGISNTWKDDRVLTTDSTGRLYLCHYGSQVNVISTVKQVKVQIEVGEQKTSYEPYQGETVAISWQTEAGTIYGGTVTLNKDGSADVENDRLFVVLDGSPDEDWDTGSYGASVKWTTPETIYNKIVIPASSSQPYDAIANYLRPIAQAGSWYAYDNFFAYTGRPISMKCSTIGDLANWRNYLSENPLTILFKLRNPETYHFDNIGQLNSFLGTNNIWHNMNGDITVEYWKKQ